MQLIDLKQRAGDFSDPASGDLHIIRLLSHNHVHADLGGGRFSEWGFQGKFGLSPPYFANSIIVDQPHRVDVLTIPWTLLQSDDLEDMLPKDGHFGAAHTAEVRDIEMYALFDHLWRVEDPVAQSLEAETARLWIMQRLVGWSSRRPARSPVEKLSPLSLARAKERLEALGSTPPSLAELAALCGLSAHHFCRAFKATTGLPPHRWQIVRRVERAQDLLAGTTLPIAEVGALVGYDDPAYFSRLFKRETGFGPSVWRRERLS
jgi:AraC family transcriptional regulator